MGSVGVIVPVYKVEPYLRRCLDSILGQSFSDFLLVLVDDGSPDNCGTICDEYARLDKRVHVIHQENAGLSAARNAGIDWCAANPQIEWLTFIDSDDWVHPLYLQTLIDAAEKSRTLVSACAYARTSGEELDVSAMDISFDKWNAKQFYTEKCTSATVAWAKLYRKHCFERMRYPLGRIHEDEFVTYQMLFQSKEVAYTPAPLYAYYVNPQSITGSGWSVKRLDAWEAFEQQLAYFQKMGDSDLVNFRYRGYLENAMVNYQAARKAEQTPEVRRAIRRMDRQIPKLLRRMWKAGCIEFWMDFDILLYFRPVWARVQRFLLEHRQN